MLHLLVFLAYINEMNGLRTKSPVKISSGSCEEGFISGVKGIIFECNPDRSFLGMLCDMCMSLGRGMEWCGMTCWTA
jgi:hypothetical protein